MTSKVPRLVVAFVCLAMLAAHGNETAPGQSHARDPSRITDAGWMRHAMRWWLGDGRRPPVPVGQRREEALASPPPDSAGATDELFDWWFGDGSRPPHPIAP